MEGLQTVEYSVSSVQNPSITIILPTINEAESLRELVPAIFQTLSETNRVFEVLIVDDGSTDDTALVVEDLSARYSTVRAIFRGAEARSLPNSIQEGIDGAQGDLIVWMDADGSMPSSVILDMLNMWERSMQDEKMIIVASRFVVGGGIKGIEVSGATPLRKVVKNLRKSEDYLFAVFLSWILNRIMWVFLGRCCRDMTSGFVLAPKSLLKNYVMKGNYGDYFPRFVYQCHCDGVRIIEIPYIISMRKSGQSKTGSTPLQILKSGAPYLSVFREPVMRLFKRTR